MYEIQEDVFIAHAQIVTINKKKKTVHMVNGFTYQLDSSEAVDAVLDDWNHWFKCE